MKGVSSTWYCVDWQDSNLRATIIMFTIDFIQLVIMAPDQSEVAPVHHAIIFFIPNSIFCFLLFKVFMKPNIVKQPMKY